MLTGCAGGEYHKYVEAQHTANLIAYANQKPLIEIEAEPGKEITGLRSLRVNLPVQAAKVEQPRPSEWAGVVTSGLSIAGGVLGIRYMGQYMTAISNYDRTPNSTVTTTTTSSETNSRNSTTETTSRNTTSSDMNNPVSTETTNTNTSTQEVPNAAVN